MLDSWAADDLNAFCTLIQTFTFIPGQGVYSLGPGGNFNGSRPTDITLATLVVLSNPALPLTINIDLIDEEEYQLISLQQTPSTYARKLFYNPTYVAGTGQGTCSFWPVPTEADNVQLSSAQMLSAGFTSGANVFDAPPGYQDAVRYHLAIRLAMEWNRELKAGVAELAAEALAKVQRRNAPTPQMYCNPGMTAPRSDGRGGFNWLTGDPQ